MAQLLKLTLVERNDVTVELAATRSAMPVAIDDGADLELYLKTTEYQDDADAIVLTRDDGEIVVTNAAAGMAEATIDGTLITPDLTFWRYDLIDGGARHTVLYGPLEVVNV